MKKSLLWALVLVMSISLVAFFSSGGCRKAEEQVAEEATSELEEEALDGSEVEEESAVEEVDEEVIAEEQESEEELGLEALIMEQEWVGLPAGTEVTVGEEVFTVEGDLAGIEVTLRIQNNSPGAEILFPPVNLEKADGTIVEIFHLDQLDETETSNDWPDKGIKFEPNQTRVLKIASTLAEISKCEGELFIDHPQYKWELKLNQIPPREELYKVEEEAAVEEEVEEQEEKSLPTYSQVLSTYPANAELCQTEADILSVNADGALLSGTIELVGGQSSVSVQSGTMSIVGVSQSGGYIYETSSNGTVLIGPLLDESGNATGRFGFQCYGTKLTVRVQVTLEGKTYQPGTKLTVDKDLHWIEVSGWD